MRPSRCRIAPCLSSCKLYTSIVGLCSPGAKRSIGLSALPAALVEKLKQPLNIELTRKLWVAAAILGLLRTMVNDPNRAAIRDRGHSYNILNDLQGALGELVGIGLIERLKDAGLRQEVRGLLDLGKSVNLADLAVFDGARSIFIDVKCHFDENNKKLFLINEEARKRSIDRQVTAFLPIVAAAWRRNAIIGRPIPIEEPSKWKLGTLGDRQDPCRQLELDELEKAFFDRKGLYWIRRRKGQWGGWALNEFQVIELRRSVNGTMLDRLKRTGFSLDGYTYSEVVASLLDLLPQQLQHDLRLDENL